ncbi:hypothetical protein ZWY2020_021891 [Hordeum vulgare]|nr:hypothetical protein ZWY2020_021891 [Hordeum vulgare]
MASFTPPLPSPAHIRRHREGRKEIQHDRSIAAATAIQPKSLRPRHRRREAAIGAPRVGSPIATRPRRAVADGEGCCCCWLTQCRRARGLDEGAPPWGRIKTPKTKQSADGEGARVRYGLASMQGWRTTMEDAVSLPFPPPSPPSRSLCLLGCVRLYAPLLSTPLCDAQREESPAARLGESRVAILRRQIDSLARVVMNGSTQRSVYIVYTMIGDVYMYIVGKDEYDELALSEVIFAITSAVKDVCAKPPTERLFLDKYGRICLCLDEIVWQAVSELGAGAKSLLLSLEPPSSSDASGEYFFSDYGLGSQHIL